VLEAAAQALEATSRDDEALTLQVASDGGFRLLRGVLDRLTGRPTTEQDPRS